MCKYKNLWQGLTPINSIQVAKSALWRIVYLINVDTRNCRLLAILSKIKRLEKLSRSVEVNGQIMFRVETVLRVETQSEEEPWLQMSCVYALHKCCLNH